MKTFTQLSKEELAAFEKEFRVDSFDFSEKSTDILKWLLAHDRRIIKAAFKEWEEDEIKRRREEADLAAQANKPSE